MELRHGLSRCRHWSSARGRVQQAKPSANQATQSQHLGSEHSRHTHDPHTCNAHTWLPIRTHTCTAIDTHTHAHMRANTAVHVHTCSCLGLPPTGSRHAVGPWRASAQGRHHHTCPPPPRHPAGIAGPPAKEPRASPSGSARDGCTPWIEPPATYGASKQRPA